MPGNEAEGMSFLSPRGLPELHSYDMDPSIAPSPGSFITIIRLLILSLTDSNPKPCQLQTLDCDQWSKIQAHTMLYHAPTWMYNV